MFREEQRKQLAGLAGKRRRVVEAATQPAGHADDAAAHALASDAKPEDAPGDGAVRTSCAPRCEYDGCLR
eukprot:7587090-Pyramimonas_sp.AAC.1